MNELMIFNNPEFGEIRTIEADGASWFVGRDVAAALGYQNGSRDINRHVGEEDKGVTEMVTPGGRQAVPIINKSGLYSRHKFIDFLLTFYVHKYIIKYVHGK